MATAPKFPPGVLSSSSLNALRDIVQDHEDALATTWTPYTPAWTALGTAPAIGNGTLTGSYKTIGTELIIVRIRFTAGSTSTYGTSSWLFSVPAGFSASASAINETSGSLYILDSGSQSRVGVVRFNTSSTLFLESNSGGVTSTVPQTWATSDQAIVTVAYEPA